ncbi:MAG: SGNH/GDSL hydrolase family protein [Alphaproteobacteria bacterium]|nr:SGNH/GDSL hydrolase family protein [Alphaproteobacteria bacterium]
MNARGRPGRARHGNPSTGQAAGDGVVVERKGANPSRRGRLVALVAAGCSIAIALLVAGAMELYLRTSVFDPTKYYVRMPGWEIIFHPSSEGTPGIFEDARVLSNALGARGEMPPSNPSPSILAIGGSTTEDHPLGDADMWTGQLQANLRKCSPRAWVSNLGRAGTDSRHYLIQLPRVLPQYPPLDRVVVLVGLNDMLFDLRIPLPKRMPDNWELQQSFMYIPPQAPKWYERSALYQAARRIIENAARLRDPDAALVRVADLGSAMEAYKKRYRQIAPEDFVDILPDLTTKLDDYRRRLEEIAALVAKHGAQPVFVTQPSLWKPEMNDEERSRLYAGGLASPDEWMVNPHVKWYTTEAMRRALGQYNDVLRQVCQSKKLLCVDLDREMPKSAALFYDDFHFAKAGAASVGAIAAKGLNPDCGR